MLSIISRADFAGPWVECRAVWKSYTVTVVTCPSLVENKLLFIIHQIFTKLPKVIKRRGSLPLHRRVLFLPESIGLCIPRITTTVIKSANKYREKTTVPILLIHSISTTVRWSIQPKSRFNSLSPRRNGCGFFFFFFMIPFTPLVQIMAWCRQATSHYLSQCRPRSLSPYDVTRPQQVVRNLISTAYCSKNITLSPQSNL